MTNKTQLNKFKEAAKELGCNESEARFDANLKEIAKSSDKKADTEKQKD